MAHEFERAGFGRKVLCQAASIKDTTLTAWINKGLFREKSKGIGHHMVFTIGDLVTLICVRDMVAFGTLAKDAISSVQDYYPYRNFVAGSSQEARRPFNGPLYNISRNKAGKFLPNYGYDDRVILAINLYPIMEEAIAALSKWLRENDPDRGEEIVEDYLSKVRAKYPGFGTVD